MAAVSVAAAWSSGATGMAFEADIDARAMPIANKDAVRIFIGIPFCKVRDENGLAKNVASPLDHLSGASAGDASDDDASGGDASDGANGGDASDGGDASAPAPASSGRLRSAKRRPARR